MSLAISPQDHPLELTLDLGVPSRIDDGPTSFLAAPARSKRAIVADGVLRVLSRLGEATLDELVERYTHHTGIWGLAPATPQGIRSRCAELVDAGQVHAVHNLDGTRKTRPSATGRAAQVWAVS